MTVEGFVRNFSDQLDETDASLIKPETRFKELDEWSSLTALTMIAMVDSEYNLKLSADDIKVSVTIKDLFDRLKAKTN
ncbi:MAG: acyl carrier protein [Sphingobacteriales bacterium]|nr:MAG: acyl carrier protein [Sphingobacteriales bacterium]